jgi:hypothetical protein
MYELHLPPRTEILPCGVFFPFTARIDKAASSAAALRGLGEVHDYALVVDLD